MTIRYTKAAAVANNVAEAAFAKQASQTDIAADIATAQAAIYTAMASAGVVPTDGKWRVEQQFSETFGCAVIRLSMGVRE